MFKDLVLKSRSYRGYDESFRFTREQLAELVEPARFTPSSMNIQPLKYYMAWEDEQLAKIQPLTLWAGALKELNLPYPGTRSTAFIVICHDTSIVPAAPNFLKDVGIVAQTIALGAAEQGLGTCMIGNFDKEGIKKALALTDNMEPQLVLALGKPAERIVLTDAADGKLKYYRDENGVHYVPKRSLDELIIN